MRRSSSVVSGPAAALSVFMAIRASPYALQHAGSRPRLRRVGDRVLVLNAGSSTLKASVLARGSDDAKASVTVPMHGAVDAADALSRAPAAIVAAGVELGTIGAAG